MNHFAHYIKRKINAPSGKPSCFMIPYAELQPEDQGFMAPIYHSVPTNSGVAARVKPGDTIWLFAQLTSPWGTLPPSLDGVVRVAEIDRDKKQAGRYRFAASSESKWFPLHSANELISQLRAVDIEGRTRKLLNTERTSIGQALQFLREISDPDPLCKHAAQLDAILPDFISYRIKDGTESAFNLATLLIEAKRAVFWDRWSLPRRLAERNEQVGAVPLDSHISSVIRRSRVVWGVASNLYAIEGSYSAQEKELAIRLNKFRPFPPWINS